MKAILVIDTDAKRIEDLYVEHIWNDYVLVDLGKEMHFRPMPCKRETHVYWKSVGIGNIPTHEISDYDKGWNDCLQTITGETE